MRAILLFLIRGENQNNRGVCGAVEGTRGPRGGGMRGGGTYHVKAYALLEGQVDELKKVDDVRKRGKTSYRKVWLTSAKTSSKRVPSGPACECSFVRTASTRPAGISAS